MTQFLSNREIYESVICALVLQTRERLWIATFIAPILWCEMFPSKKRRKRRDNTLDRIDMINRIYLNLVNLVNPVKNALRPLRSLRE